MAYVSQELKAKLAPSIRDICKRYGIKASISVHNHSSLVVTIKQGSIDFIGNLNETMTQRPGGFRNDSPARDHIDINPYWYKEHFTGQALAFLTELIPAMKGSDYFDDSDISTDYFHCSHYINVHVGRWDQPYALVK